MTTTTCEAHDHEHAAAWAAWEAGLVNFKDYAPATANAKKAKPLGPLKERTPDSVFSALDKSQSRLMRMLTYCRPYGSKTEANFVRQWIDSVDGMQTDPAGNKWCIVGDAEPTVAYSAHTDTVHHREGYQALTHNRATDLITLADESAASCLGADCTTGVWLQLEMIRRGIPGMYLFFRGEEVGCIGSSAMAAHNPEILDGIKAVISLDRAGYTEVITHQCGLRTASDAFADSLGDQLDPASYYPSANGVYTDSNELVDIVGECTNLAVGYKHQHGTNEQQHLGYASALLEALCGLDHSKLVFKRQPGDFESRYSKYGKGWSTYTAGNNAPQDDYVFTPRGYTSDQSQDYEGHNTEAALIADLTDAIREYPEAIAVMLAANGYDLSDISEAIFEHTGYVKYNHAF